MMGKITSEENCPYCKNNVRYIEIREYEDYFEKIYYCSKCGYICSFEQWLKEYL